MHPTFLDRPALLLRDEKHWESNCQMEENMNTPLISVIVPVYRVEAYLNRCVESLIGQTYRNLEIILVDDGSPDCCGEMCDEWARRDSRIKAYHKLNGGLSDARNHGIRRAQGEYIAFVDSDDYVSDGFVMHLYSLMRNARAEIACCAPKLVTDGREKFEQNEEERIQVLDGRAACGELYSLLYAQMVVSCGKLYKSSLVKEHLFPVGRLHEDEATTYKYLYSSRRVVISDIRLYAYYQNEKSITHTRSAKNDTDTNVAYQERAAFFRELKEWSLYAKTMNFYTGVLISRGTKDSLKEIRRLFQSHWDDPHVFFRTKIRMLSYMVRNGRSNKENEEKYS